MAPIEWALPEATCICMLRENEMTTKGNDWAYDPRQGQTIRK